MVNIKSESDISFKTAGCLYGNPLFFVSTTKTLLPYSLTKISTLLVIK